jgi:hypothetical protein
MGGGGEELRQSREGYIWNDVVMAACVASSSVEMPGTLDGTVEVIYIE